MCYKEKLKKLTLINKKGFTLAEMLVTIAIIVVLAALVVPLLSNKIEASREATDLWNLRSAVSMVVDAALLDEMEHKNVSPKPIGKVYYDKYSSDKSEWYCINILATQTKWNWQSNDNNSSYNISGINVSSSIRGWNVRHCIAGENIGKTLITGMTESGYQTLVANNK